MLPLFPFTENPSSIAMADLIHSSLRENNLKRLFYVPILVVVDTCGKENIGTEERKDCIERTVKIAIHFGFDVYVTSLETPEYFQKVENKIFMAADPYCQFTKLIGADIDRTDRGLGMRSSRYTMLIENNIVKVIKSEEDTATCAISAAENFIKEI